MKRILVPLDGTKNAECALAALEQILGPEDEFVLLAVRKPEEPLRKGYGPGVVAAAGVIVGPGGGMIGAGPDLPVYAETTDQALQSQVAESKDYLERLAAGLRDDGYTVETEVLIDENPDRAIIEYARKMQPTFIAMCRRTSTGLREFIFGSTASSIARADVSPVLFLPLSKPASS